MRWHAVYLSAALAAFGLSACGNDADSPPAASLFNASDADNSAADSEFGPPQTSALAFPVADIDGTVTAVEKE